MVAISLVAAGWLGCEAADWPDVARLAREEPATTAFMDRYRKQQRELGQGDRVAWVWAPYEALSPHLIQAVLVAEDIGFFAHRGFEPAEIWAALREALAAGDPPRGASTITQQLAKNLWLTPSRNPIRKLREALLTRALERHLSKRRILALYLNVVEFGPGIYGAEAAAQAYFERPAATLSAHQAALLAASLPRPATWTPRSTHAGYHASVERIEQRMAEAQFLWRWIGRVPGEPAPAAVGDTLASG